ncbi:hypothetical protein TNCV_2198431 [Trichonephila clavipes]|nr:hypothetical protein TNCV_2198431 [Trichonephila clavipes]
MAKGFCSIKNRVSWECFNTTDCVLFLWSEKRDNCAGCRGVVDCMEKGRNCCCWAVGSLVVRASDSRPEGLGSMPDATKHPLSTHGFTCINGGDRGRVAIYRPFGEFRRAKIALSPVWCSRPTTGVPLAHATMNFVGLDLTTSDRWHQKTTTTTK